jgi:hypothetical protein
MTTSVALGSTERFEESFEIRTIRRHDNTNHVRVSFLQARGRVANGNPFGLCRVSKK